MLQQTGAFSPRGGVPPMLRVCPPGVAQAAPQFGQQPGSPFGQQPSPFARQPSLPPHVGGAMSAAAGQEAVEVRITEHSNLVLVSCSTSLRGSPP